MAESLNKRYRDFASKKRFILIVIVLLISLLPLSSSIADDTLVGGSGYTAFPINTNKIQMLSEHVTITMGSYNSPDAAIPHGHQDYREISRKRTEHKKFSIKINRFKGGKS
jgi:hypothetical protein